MIPYFFIVINGEKLISNERLCNLTVIQKYLTFTVGSYTAVFLMVADKLENLQDKN